ncbi:basic secretory protein-like protein [Shimazuella kribbensis]|uniref:basic secretory protein-like protein n=1 Tax=Shimazuella kribbensis TaxID=139808 RepID=UPI000426FFB9|nr:basic secretory protein-like protein [Shimazuella kribbensis]
MGLSVIKKGVVVAIAMGVTIFSLGIQPAHATKKVVTSGDYKLTIDYSDSNMSSIVSNYETTFKRTYKQMAQEFGTGKAPTEVFLQFERNEKYPYAYTKGNTIYMNPDYAKENPSDQGLLAHELFHVVDAYPDTVHAPDWFLEGMAEYARNRYSILDTRQYPPVNNTQNYTDSYGVTARFFAWIQDISYPSTMVKIHQRVQNKEYSDDLFQEYTGKKLKQLWEEYKKNPGNVESSDWSFANEKVRYSGEVGDGKWKEYLDFTYLSGVQNYLNTRNNGDTHGKINYKIVDASGKTVITYTTDDLWKNMIHSFDPLSEYNKEPKSGKYTLYVQIPDKMNIDFELNHGNTYH